MLFKLLLASALAVAPVLAMTQEVESGQWPDGYKLMWQCQKGASGVVKFVFISPTGEAHQGQLSCGIGV